MTLKEIQGIIKDFEASALTTLEMELEGFKLKLSKLSSAPAPNAPIPDNATPCPAPVLPNTTCVAVKSPLVGPYYSSATPAGEPFVQVGQIVRKGQTVCIIEAMKIMNEIAAPVAGVVERIDVKNGQVVGYDQVLITLHTGDGNGE
ncbi:MAG: biotin/lipoyl-containing protein [bacterium]